MKGIIVALLLLPGFAEAGRILHSSATVEDGRYTASVVAQIDASPEVVLRIITDYAHLTDINPSILESSVIHVYSPRRYRVRTRMRVCILIFCRDVMQVQDVEQLDDTRIVADIVPGLSDFRSGHAEWTLEGSAGQTRLNFSAEVEPDFWVPPVIGAWLFRRKIVSEMMETSSYMEMDTLERTDR